MSVAFVIGGYCKNVTADVAMALSKREWALLSPAARELVERFDLMPDATDRMNAAPIGARTHGTLNHRQQGVAS